MALTAYFASDQLDTPATDDEIGHLVDALGHSVPDDLRAFWLTSATFNGRILMASGEPGPYLRIFHPSTVLEATRRAAASGALVFGQAEDWDYGVVAGSPDRWVDIDRSSGEILSDLGGSFTEFLEALRAEHAAEDNLLT